MGNLDITQRNSLERSTLAGNDGLRHGTEKGAMVYVVIALVIAGALGHTPRSRRSTAAGSGSSSG